MGIKSIFQNGADTIFKSFGDVVDDQITLIHMGSTTFNVSAGTNSFANKERDLVSGIFTVVDIHAVDGVNILESDIMFVGPQSGFDARPKKKDIMVRIYRGASTNLEVMRYKEDAAQSIWRIQLRENDVQG